MPDMPMPPGGMPAPQQAQPQIDPRRLQLMQMLAQQQKNQAALQQLTPAQRVQQGHGYEFSHPTRPSTIDPAYEDAHGIIEAMGGQPGREHNDLRMLHEGYARYQQLEPKEKLKWVMRTVGNPPIPGGQDWEDVSPKDQKKLQEWQTQTVDKIIDAFIKQEGFPNPPISR